jgi:F-type H+-transporting ATPase subunit b
VQAGEPVRGGVLRSFPAWLGLLAGLVTTRTAWASEGLELPTTAGELGALVQHAAPLAFVVFPILVYAVNKMLLAPLVRILVTREERTTGAQQRAAELRIEAGRTAEQLEARLREARIQAQRTRASLLAEAEAEERRMLDLARTEAAHASAAVRSSVAAELESARLAVGAQASSLARDAAAQILGRAI